MPLRLGCQDHDLVVDRLRLILNNFMSSFGLTFLLLRVDQEAATLLSGFKDDKVTTDEII